jgi:hypothetical protein
MNEAGTPVHMHIKELEMVVYPRLLHNSIGSVARQRASIHRERAIRDRAVPNLVIALALAAILAAGGFEGFHDLTVEALTH